MGTSAGVIKKIDVEKIKKNGAKLFFQESEDARNCFIEYYNSGVWKESLREIHNSKQNNNNNNKKPERDNSIRASFMLKNYVLPEEYISDEISKQIKNINSTSNNQKEHSFESILFDENSDKFTADFIIDSIFPLFLESDEYKSYIEERSFSGSYEISIRAIIPSEQIVRVETTREHRLDLLSKKQTKKNLI
jgi:hypothetical protein